MAIRLATVDHTLWCNPEQHLPRTDGADPGVCLRQRDVGTASVWITQRDGRTVFEQDTPDPMAPDEYRAFLREGGGLLNLLDNPAGEPPVPGQTRSEASD